MTKRKPVMDVATLACRIRDFAESHHWIRGQSKALWGPRATRSTQAPLVFAYCSLGYIREVVDQVSAEGFTVRSVHQSENQVMVLLAEEIEGAPPPRGLVGVIPTIITFNDTKAAGKEEVMAKFEAVCNRAKEMVTP